MDILSIELIVGILLVIVLCLLVYKNINKSNGVRISHRVKRPRYDEKHHPNPDGSRRDPIIDSTLPAARDLNTTEGISSNVDDGDIPVLLDVADESIAATKESSTGDNKQPFSQTSLNTQQQLDLFDDMPEVRPRRGKHSKKSDKKAVKEQRQSLKEEFIIINLKAFDDRPYQGVELFECLQRNKMRYGEQNIFHYHPDDQSQAWFKMANGLKPGTFDYHNQEDFSTIMLCFILVLKQDDNRPEGFHIKAIDQMIDTINNIKDELDGRLQDQDRSDLNIQATEHFRQQAQDYERQIILFNKQNANKN